MGEKAEIPNLLPLNIRRRTAETSFAVEGGARR